MKEKINKILWDFAQSKLTHDEATQQVLDLFDVSRRSELLLDFLQWYNDHHPENYIPNSRLGNYLQEKSSNSQ